MNLTGSPDYGARIIYKGDTGDGCSSDQYKQFDTSNVAGPTYNSVGLESGRNVLIGCPITRTDLAIARNIRFGKGGRQLQLRVDAFNLFNQAAINGRSNSIQFNSPTDQTPIRNPQFCNGGGPRPLRGWRTGRRSNAAAQERGLRRGQWLDDQPDQQATTSA